jgi:hypothetical protein
VRRKRTPPLLEQSLITVEIDLLEPDTEHVTGRTRDEDGFAGSIRMKGLAQARHIRLDAVGGACGGSLAPELIDQDVPGNDLVGA